MKNQRNKAIRKSAVSEDAQDGTEQLRKTTRPSGKEKSGATTGSKGGNQKGYNQAVKGNR